MEFARAAEMYALGTLAPEELPAAAVDALDAGLYSPSLLELSLASVHNIEDIKRWFIRALSELGMPQLSPVEAGLALARRIANDILQGAIPPYEGAREIWWEIYARLNQLKELRGFVGCASEYEDDINNQDFYNAQIIEECKELLGLEGKIQSGGKGDGSGKEDGADGINARGD